MPLWSDQNLPTKYEQATKRIAKTLEQGEHALATFDTGPENFCSVNVLCLCCTIEHLNNLGLWWN